MTLGEVLRRSTEYLERKGVDSPRPDAERLLAHALGLERIQLYTEFDRPLTEAELAPARALVERRGAREPLAYILGEWGFRHLLLKTDARALVPRPETEVLVERALALLEGVAEPRVVDVGTGTGAIALALAQELPGARVTALDVSPDALALARENAERTGLDVELRQADAREGLPGGPYDLVASNPPYVEADELPELQPEVRDFEPRIAVVGEGLPEAVATAARDALRPGGAFVMEIHAAHGPRVAASLQQLGFGDVVLTPDLAGRDRVVEGRLPAA
jgi:release factor glutamine methyltransferase